MSFEIDTQKAVDWMAKWQESFESVNSDPTSLRTLIYLTLLERQNEMSSYQNIADELVSRGLVIGAFDKIVPLRNGMNQLVKSLATNPLYEIESRKNKKEARYRLKRRNGLAGTSSGLLEEGEVVHVLNDRQFRPSTEAVAAKLMTDRRMPFYSIYLPLRAASRWVLYSEAESRDRSQYESTESERLLRDWLSKYREGEISLIGLGVGEGLGEIEILRKLLDEKLPSGSPAYTRIHYCAIDSNVHLITSHVQRIEDTFNDEIKNKRLVCGVICGNFLEDFSKLIQKLRAEFVETRLFAGLDQGFLPNTGTIISILGNVVGNLEKRASEWSYFQPVLEGLKGYDLAFLLGVSVRQTDEKGEVLEQYSKDLEDLLLATPRYLTHETGILESHCDDNSAAEEFVLPEDETAKGKRWTKISRDDYEGDGLRGAGAYVTGKIYEFSYKTQWDLSMKSDGEMLRIPAGTDLLLYNIIKFDENALVKFLESKGLFQPRQKFRADAISSGDEDRRYVVIAVTNKSPGQNGHGA